MNGKQLKASRKKLNLTQVELAKLLGVAANTVAKWERDEQRPPGNLLKLSMLAIKNNL